MKQKSSRRTVLAAAMAVAGVFGLVTSPAFADVHVSQNGATLTVTAPSTLAGKGLLLQTDAESAGTWTTATNIVAAVPAAGGEYTVDLAALGIANGTPCRIASATCYERLDMLLMDNRDDYINTGIQGKNVYGVKMGFYPTKRGTAGTDDANFALNCGKGGDTGWAEGKGGFHVGLNQLTKEEHDANNVRARLEGPVLWGYQGYNSGSGERPTWKTDALNDIVFTNRVFTLNGTVVKSSIKKEGAIASNELTVTMGRNNPASSYYSLLGYWGWLRLENANGDAIIDYVPVRRGTDGRVGFWDKVSKALVCPSKSGRENRLLDTGCTPTGEIVADETTVEDVSGTITPNRIFTVNAEGASATITVPAGLLGEQLIVAWDSADKGDDLAAWANRAVLAESAVAGDLTQKLTRLGIKNGDTVRIFAANVYKPLDMLQMTTTGCWIDTGFKGTDVYGVRFGYYTTGLNKKSGDWCGAIGCGKDNSSGFSDARGGFLVASNNDENDLGKTVWMYRGYYDNKNKPSAKTDSINEYAFTNGVFTLNGTIIANNLNNQAPPNHPNAVSTNETYNINIGRSPNAATGMAFGWWSHVSFDDASGNRILDYIPVQRVSDGKVGFYDRATLTFVTSSGTDDFTAGTVTNDTPVVAVNASSATCKVTGIQGLIILFK